MDLKFLRIFFNELTPMQKIILLSLVLGSAAHAGTSAKEVIPPAPEPSLWNWFAGASAGYLVDFEEDMYHAHFGVDLPKNGAYQHSIFLEVGWTESEDSTTFNATSFPGGSATVRSETEIIPITINYKIERAFTDRFALYLGGGIGFAFVDYESTTTNGLGVSNPTVSEDDTAFVAQIFGGVVYNVSDAFELYSGARWIYVDTDFAVPAGGVQALEDDVLLEGGVRFNF